MTAAERTDGTAARLGERERLADERERLADQRERLADEREQLADERDAAADDRDRRFPAGDPASTDDGGGPALSRSRLRLAQSEQSLEHAQQAVARSRALLDRQRIDADTEDTFARQQELAIEREMLASLDART